MTGNKSVFFFPLRSNVEYFRSKGAYLNLEARVKQALILYDGLLFQDGVYQAYFGPNGSFDTIRPNRLNSDDNLEFSDENEYKNFWLRVRPSDAGPDVPFTPIIQSEMSRAYKAQFYPIYSEIKKHGIEDVDIIPFTLKTQFSRLAKEIAKEDKKRLDFNPEIPFLRNTIIENLNQDLILISDLGYTSSIDPLHAPLIFQKKFEQGKFNPRKGFDSLQTLIPYVGDLEWEEIGQFRQEPSIIEFRKMLIRLENNARLVFHEGTVEDFQEIVLRLHNEELLKEIANRYPKGKPLVGDILLEIAGNLLPPIGIAKSVIDKSSEVKDWIDSQKSWIAALMKLRTFRQQ